MACFATPYGLRYAAHCFNRADAQDNRPALIPAGGKLGGTLAAVGAHSLRSGFLEAAKAGAWLPKMQEASRQKKVEVLLGYVHDAALFESHPSESVL